MEGIVMNVGLWALISSTDFMSKSILLLFLAASVACWALAFYLYSSLNEKQASLKRAKELLINVKGMDDFLARVSVMQSTYAGELITAFIGDFKKLLNSTNQDTMVSDRDWYLLQSSMNQHIDEAIAHEESYLAFLSTNAAAAPLLGLFGTVWGLIHAFMGIAEKHSADISAVAPGIAEALITTLSGLIVAIPALCLYAYLQAKTRRLEQEIVDLADECVWVMRGVISSPPSKTPIFLRDAIPTAEEVR
jgi:biopolymer transport protein TolQ